MRASGGTALAPALRAASALALLALGCASPALVMHTEAPPLAANFTPGEADAVARPWPGRWLVVVLAPEAPLPLDADVPDLAERAEQALRASGFAAAARVTLASLPARREFTERAAASGADGAIFVRLALRRLVRQTHTLRYLASTATFGIFPLAVMHDQLDYALELVAVGAPSGALVAEARATHSTGQDHTLWQTAEGDLFGWDVGEAIGGGRQRRRALDAAVADGLLAKAAAALAPSADAEDLAQRGVRGRDVVGLGQRAVAGVGGGDAHAGPPDAARAARSRGTGAHSGSAAARSGMRCSPR